MMFIGTVVYLVEMIMLSLCGIMFYKLFAAYRAWATASALAANPALQVPKQPLSDLSPSQDYLSVSKIRVAEEQPERGNEKQKYSSLILNDYIGEFFPETRPMDGDLSALSPLFARNAVESEVQVTARVQVTAKPQAQELDAQAKTSVKFPSQASDASSAAGAGTSEQVDDEFIVLQPRNLSPVILAHAQSAQHLVAAAENSSVPSLDELSDADSDAHITVLGDKNHAGGANIMSDKVVLAMLDEAKLICAS